MSDRGWICPSCGRGVAPSEKACDHGTEWPPVALPFWRPTAPAHFGGCEACRLSGVCNCTLRCPTIT